MFGKRICIFIALLLINLCACSTTLNSEKETESIIQQTKDDLDNDGKENDIRLIKVNDQLILKIDDSTFNLGNTDVNQDNKSPVIRVIKGNDQKKYVAFSYFIQLCGVSDKQCTLFLFKYDKGVELVWNGKLPDYKYCYSDRKVKFAFSDFDKEINGDISSVVKNMESQYKRIEPMSVNDFFNGPISIRNSNVGINDYDEDGCEEIITKYDIFNSQLYMYLTSVYIVWKMEAGKISMCNSFIIDLHTFKSRVVDKIIEDRYIEQDEVQILLDANNDKIDYKTQLEQLAKDGMIKIKGSKIVICGSEGSVVNNEIKKVVVGSGLVIPNDAKEYIQSKDVSDQNLFVDSSQKGIYSEYCKSKKPLLLKDFSPIDVLRMYREDCR